MKSIHADIPSIWAEVPATASCKPEALPPVMLDDGPAVVRAVDDLGKTMEDPLTARYAAACCSSAALWIAASRMAASRAAAAAISVSFSSRNTSVNSAS